MGASVHPTAIVDADAALGDGVSVGPHAVIGPGVEVGGGCEIGAGAQLAGPTRLGEGNRLFPHACIGLDPQDLKYAGGVTRLEIGDGNVFREFCTVHRGTEKGGGLTTIGDGNLFMVYTHVAHDCTVGSRTVFSNAATLAGHVAVEDDATIGAFSAVHQFCRVGRHAYIGGFTVVTQDALPWVKTVGHKPACYGLNTIGLRRKGFEEDRLEVLSRAVRLLLHSRLNTSQAVERLRGELAGSDDVDYLIRFLESSERGVIRSLPGRRRARGGGGAG